MTRSEEFFENYLPRRRRVIRFNLFFWCGEITLDYRKRPKVERYQNKIYKWKMELATAESKRFGDFITNTVNPALEAEREKRVWNGHGWNVV